MTRIVEIPFFLNRENQEWLLNGYRIANIDEVYTSIQNSIKNKTDMFVYKIRDHENGPSHDSEFPDVNDVIVGKVLSVIKRDVWMARVEIYDTLVYSHYPEPVIRVNGYCVRDDELSTINIEKVTRLSLSDKKNYEGNLASKY